jgi:hypothetical protein
MTKKDLIDQKRSAKFGMDLLKLHKSSSPLALTRYLNYRDEYNRLKELLKNYKKTPE